MSMTIRDAFSITLKVLGFYFTYTAFYLLTTTIRALSLLTSQVQREQMKFAGISVFALLAPSVIPLIIAGAAAYVLIKFSDRIAERVIKLDKDIQIFGGDNWQKEVFILSLRIFGAYEIAVRFANLVWQVSLPANYKEDIYTVLCLGIGVYFLFGAKHIVNLVFREKKIEPIAEKPAGDSALPPTAPTPPPESPKPA